MPGCGRERPHAYKQTLLNMLICVVRGSSDSFGCVSEWWRSWAPARAAAGAAWRGEGGASSRTWWPSSFR
eukprot:scaffold6691_cov358-Prasinococcus_capsulatus_cf.AAC.1